MALNPKTAVARRNAALDAAMDALDSGGTIRIYDGLQPTDADTALGSQVMLAELALSSDAFAAASGGSKAAAAITNATAAATGTATWGTFYKSGVGAQNRALDFSVGTSGANLNLNSVAIQSGATVSISSFSITMAA